MSTSPQLQRSILPLENGDCLTRDEFERRYRAMPQLKKAELIAGIVYMASPLRLTQHGQPHAQMMTWLGVYHAMTKGVLIGDNTTVRLDLENEPQPDAILMIDPQRGGQANISEDGYIEGAPELVVEVASSSASYDLHQKLQVYCQNGVLEYIVWLVYEQQIRWFRLEAGEYLPIEPNQQGVIESQVFPGLWLAVSSLIVGDLAEVLAVLQQGLASKEHQQFIDRLNQ
ncbi:MAG: Uma2 family endonuclease [Cyanobacteria bacterium J06592_8]